MDKKKSRYYTNKKIKSKIDKLLFKSAQIQCTLGVDSTEEEKDKARAKTEKVAYAIYEIDKPFAEENFPHVDFCEVL
jgi:hypothetical protein